MDHEYAKIPHVDDYPDEILAYNRAKPLPELRDGRELTREMVDVETVLLRKRRQMFEMLVWRPERIEWRDKAGRWNRQYAVSDLHLKSRIQDVVEGVSGPKRYNSEQIVSLDYHGTKTFITIRAHILRHTIVGWEEASPGS